MLGVYELTARGVHYLLPCLSVKISSVPQYQRPDQVVVFLPARASEQGNVIGSVHIYIYIYIYMCVQKKIVIERTRDLNYLKFVATDFSPKTISPSAGENQRLQLSRNLRDTPGISV